MIIKESLIFISRFTNISWYIVVLLYDDATWSHHGMSVRPSDEIGARPLDMGIQGTPRSLLLTAVLHVLQQYSPTAVLQGIFQALQRTPVVLTMGHTITPQAWNI